MANRESRSSWKDFLIGLRKRGLNGVEFVVADDHAGLRSANPPFSLRYATRSPHACAVASAS
jgi:transposase-like protein